MPALFAAVALVSLVLPSGLHAAGPTGPLAYQSDLDHVWTVTAAVLVFLMQGGFLLLEAGQVRSKNSVNVAQKNLMDFIVATVVFGAFGYMLMFGDSAGGWIGWQPDLLFFGSAGDWSLTFFVFQLMFCGTAATIMSGAVAERMTISGYMLLALLIAAIIYPAVGHWAWGGFVSGDASPILASIGFMDFAGSTVVHSTGAWVALAAIIVIGPRLGKFDADGRPRVLHGHSPVLATAGALLLWVGWIGFNGGSMLAGTSDFANVVVNTVVSGAAGGFTLMLVGRAASGCFRPEAPINGVLGGLVGITAGADVMGTQSAFLVGALSGLVVFGATLLLENVLKLDDPLGAIPVHGFAGAFGTLAVPFFAPADALLAGDRLAQLAVQAQGVALVFGWSFGVAFALLKGVDWIMRRLPGGGPGLRVSERAEVEGLNLHEHGAPMGTGILQAAMAELAADPAAGLRRIHLDYGDEAHETSVLYNRIVENIEAERAAEQAKYEREKAKRMEVEGEIANVVASCVAGDYSRRLETEGRAGFLLELCRGINRLCDTTETAMDAIRGSLHKVAKGDLAGGQIEGDFRGTFGDIQNDMNGMLRRLESTLDEVRSTVDAAAAGDFSQQVAIADKQGFFLQLAERTNALCSIAEQGLGEVLHVLERVSAGDLTARMSTGFAGRFAQLGEAVEAMAAGMGNLIRRGRDSAAEVTQAARTLARASEEAQTDATAQTEAIARALARLGGMVSASTDAADEAVATQEICQRAYEKAEKGHDLTRRFADRMSDIEKTTQQIIRALEEIESLAKQTNLLSVNASVEAVRGSGQGGSNEGFKVVAGEVRDLAAKSRRAAEEIRERTAAVQDAVAAGSETVREADLVLSEIIRGMAESTERTSALARIGAEQRQSAESVLQEVGDVAQRARHGRGLAAQNAASAMTLEKSAAQTIAEFEPFNLPDDRDSLAA